MRRNLMTVLPVLPAIMLLVSAGSANLLINPDFSQWDNDSTPTGWTVESRSGAAVYREDAEGHAAPPCLKLIRLQAGTGNNRGVLQNCPVTPGQDYTVAAWFKTPDMPDTMKYVSVRVLITWRNSSGGAIGSTSPPYIRQPVWTEQRYVATAPNNPNGDSIAASADVIIRCYGRAGSTPGGIALIDDVLLVEGSGVGTRQEAAAGRSDLRVLPNPAGPDARIRLELPEAGRVLLAVYDLAGTVRKELFRGVLEPGRHEFNFAGAGALPDGLYFVVLEREGRRPVVSKLLIQR